MYIGIIISDLHSNPYRYVLPYVVLFRYSDGQTIIYKALHRKLQVEQQQHELKTGVKIDVRSS